MAKKGPRKTGGPKRSERPMVILPARITNTPPDAAQLARHQRAIEKILAILARDEPKREVDPR